MDSKKSDKITVDFNAAIEHLNKFITVHPSEKQFLVQHLHMAIKNATYRMIKYRAKYGVDMEKMELLRDVIAIKNSILMRLIQIMQI